MSDIPGWALNQLGKHVILTHEIEAGRHIYTHGHVGKLISIQHGEPPYATVALDLEDEGYEENVPFPWLRPHLD